MAKFPEFHAYNMPERAFVDERGVTVATEQDLEEASDCPRVRHIRRFVAECHAEAQVKAFHLAPLLAAPSPSRHTH